MDIFVIKFKTVTKDKTVNIVTLDHSFPKRAISALFGQFYYFGGKTYFRGNLKILGSRIIFIFFAIYFTNLSLLFSNLSSVKKI